MKANIGHVGINLSNSTKSFRFWKDLLKYLEFKIIGEASGHFDAYGKGNYLCISVVGKNYKAHSFHRKRIGLNHIAFSVSSRKHVDLFVSEFLLPRCIKPLYGGAKAYPQYVDGYYAVYLEDPDQIKIEIVYEPGLKAF